MFPTTWYESLSLFTAEFIGQLSLFLPRMIGALLILVIGAFLAKALKRVVVKVLETFRVSSILKNTPVEHFVTDSELGQRVEDVIGSVFYWLFMLIVVHTSVTILGLEPISDVLDKLLNYLPSIISAIIVLFVGTLLAGAVESLVKGSIKTIDGRSARLLGKVSSYLVITVAVMAAISELGIASEFITIIFVGFVAMLSLGSGLALGLGGQDMVRKMLNNWHTRTLDEVKE